MTSFLYIISDDIAYKVGISKDPHKRIKQLQTGSPKKIKIVYLFELPQSKIFNIEKQCHNALQKKFKKRGEWFHGATEFTIRIIVDEICEPHIITFSSF